MKTATKGTKTNLNKNSPEGNKSEAKHGKRKVPIKDFTGKSTKDINELHELKQKLKTVEQERDSLRTVIEMLKADNDQRSDHEWQVIEAKTNKTAPTKGMPRILTQQQSKGSRYKTSLCKYLTSTLHWIATT